MRMMAACLLTALTSACTHAPVQSRQPAVISAPTAASRTELHDIVSAALANPQLILADDALTQDSTLIVERQPRRDAAGVLLDGRERGMPERFQLLLEGTSCLLLHERTGQTWSLRHTTCQPLAAQP